MDKDMELVLLTVATKCRNGTQTITDYTGIFIKNGLAKLKQVEREVVEMVRSDGSSWNCGGVTGTPERMFTESDRKNLERYGLNRRFSL